ncbi:hypothetical protein Ddye_011248 [Dipteronia dyeriana]|uniref:Uncharacterized protein n=1 Tax=Dipteronia dyeriana TaxID=168575 RepID=A0AAD9X248_9ROSI|nr:hypothetical protein Ddye_011248 [Dipteronia dyeriana]
MNMVIKVLVVINKCLAEETIKVSMQMEEMEIIKQVADEKWTTWICGGDNEYRCRRIGKGLIRDETRLVTFPVKYRCVVFKGEILEVVFTMVNKMKMIELNLMYSQLNFNLVKPFPHYERLVTVFVKDQATCSMAESASEALGNMRLETGESDTAGFTQPLSTPSNVASASSDPNTRATSKWKRKRNVSSTTEEITKLRELCQLYKINVPLVL